MEDVVREYGQGFLALICVIGMTGIIAKFWEPGNIVYTAIVNYMTSICG